MNVCCLNINSKHSSRVSSQWTNSRNWRTTCTRWWGWSPSWAMSRPSGGCHPSHSSAGTWWWTRTSTCGCWKSTATLTCPSQRPSHAIWLARCLLIWHICKLIKHSKILIKMRRSKILGSFKNKLISKWIKILLRI